MQEIVGTLIVIGCVWAAWGISTLKYEIEELTDMSRKLHSLSMFQYTVVLLKSFLYGPFTKSKVFSRL